MGLPFVQTVEPGQVGERGRYRDMPVPYGAASLQAPEEVIDEDRLTWLLDAVLPHIDTLRELGATEAHVSIGYFWRDQCNLAYSPDELAKLSRLGIALWMSCYEEKLQPTESG